jgi:hypothetical protein
MRKIVVHLESGALIEINGEDYEFGVNEGVLEIESDSESKSDYYFNFDRVTYFEVK